MPDSINIVRNCGSWQGSPVTMYEGSLGKVRNIIPCFERRLFTHGFPPLENKNQSFLPGMNPHANCYHDAIVRIPIKRDEPEIPVGIVSKGYTLLQHQSVVDEILSSIKDYGIAASEVTAQVALTEYGERMRLSIQFPKRFDLMLNDDDYMALRLECFNSVEGSTRFMAVIGWLRFVCSNGMVIGVADTYYRKRHKQEMQLSEVSTVLKKGIAATVREKSVYQRWITQKVINEKLKKWVNGALAKQWGVKAATRTWHITRTGCDVAFADPFEKREPTDKTVIVQNQVPGAILPGDTVFAVAQALSWLAKERRDIQEQLEWKQQIPNLIRHLIGQKNL